MFFGVSTWLSRLWLSANRALFHQCVSIKDCALGTGRKRVRSSSSGEACYLMSLERVSGDALSKMQANQGSFCWSRRVLHVLGLVA
jgi:hypothetical protein